MDAEKFKNAIANPQDYIIIHCLVKEVFNPDYRIKFINMAQRGSMVEVVLSMNHPSIKKNQVNFRNYCPEDMIRIKKK